MTKSPEEQYAAEHAAFLLATGEVIREWAETELFFVFLLAMLLGVDEFRARIIWDTQPNWRARHRLLSRLGETYLLEPAALEFRAILKRAKAIASNRNMLAHAHGAVAERKNEIVFIWDDEDEREGFRLTCEKTVQIGNIKNWAADAIRLRDDLMVFAKAQRASVQASPKTHRAPPDDHRSTAAPAPSESTPEAPPPPPRSSQE